MNNKTLDFLKDIESMLREDFYDTINGPRLNHPEQLQIVRCLIKEEEECCGKKEMKHLYNTYEAQTPECEPIDQIMQTAANAVVALCKDHDISLRDAQSVCHSTISNHFAYHIISKAHHLRQVERGLTK
jgi:hypothetical protein